MHIGIGSAIIISVFLWLMVVSSGFRYTVFAIIAVAIIAININSHNQQVAEEKAKIAQKAKIAEYCAERKLKYPHGIDTKSLDTNAYLDEILLGQDCEK